MSAGHASTASGMPPLKRKVKQSIYEVKTVVAQYPILALPIARRRPGRVAVGRNTEIVIEGFPRTGTTFAAEAFRMAQDHPVAMACHVHAPAQISAAARLGIPAFVLAREPEDTILSFVIRHAHVSIRQALRGYLRFYKPLLPYRDRFVVGLFQDVTTDFGAVIRRINQRFGTHFREFEHTEENEKACLDAIDRAYREGNESSETLEHIVARPSELRTRLKEVLRQDYHQSLEEPRARAQQVFEEFVGFSRA